MGKSQTSKRAENGRGGGGRCPSNNLEKARKNERRGGETSHRAVSSRLPFGGVGSCRQFSHKVEEVRRLAYEQAVSGKELKCTHCGALSGCRPDDRTCGEIAAEENRRFRHDQVGLKILAI